jgi:hypothetical protein
VKNARKIYTPRASLCALGMYLTQQHMFDDFMELSIPQKKGTLCAVGKIARRIDADFCGRNGDESV